MLLELPLSPKNLITDGALFGVFGVVDFQMQPERPELFEALFALWTLEDPVSVGVDLQVRRKSKEK